MYCVSAPKSCKTRIYNYFFIDMNQDISPKELRHKIRKGEFTSNTSGYSRGFVQGNLCVLPADYAGEFLQFCQSNPNLAR